MSNPSAQWLHSPLAIVGMACRLPGADGLEQFWNLLERGGYAIQRMPDHKLDRRLYFDERKGVRGKTYSQIGGFVDERELDWSLLNITPEQATDWDLCHLSLCEVAARACVHAGYDPRNLPHRNVGVFVGHSGGTTLGGDLAYRTLLEDYLKLLAEMPEWQNVGSPMLMAKLRSELADVRPTRRDGGLPFVDAGFASGVISHNFGLTGPHMSIDAACASSLVALALGAMSLASGQTEMAIIGGASYNKADSLVLFSAAQSCSSQMSRPFDQAADGLISAEGYVTVLIKRLDRAIADGDRVHAVIRGIGYSSDGRGRSLWAPRHEGQATAIQRAYPEDIQPRSVQLIEAHATSTQVGDATEMEALTTFYAPKLEPGQRLPVGSVKSNIGHTLETAGLAGLIKSVLAIQHGVIPPSINLQNPNETIPWDSVPFYVPKSAQPWPTLAPNQPRRAAVNAFGIGGLNVHVVVDQALNLPTQATQNASDTARRNYQSLRSEQASVEPIAIVGRGLVIPGANSLQALEALLSQSIAQNIASQNVGQNVHLLASSTHRVDFVYDWRKHKVPPKQVAHANPLQFMLLEAAEQALNEANLMNEAFDRAKTAVVVGSIFGGDFGNSLFAGLRLPEFCDRLARTIAQTGIGAAQADLIIAKYVEQFLKHYPALLDETGSFTSSTLASRISKTFNLMGGAMAIDAGDVSGLAALKTSCWLLQSGSANSVLCAAAQRALDRAALDNLQKCGRLRGFYPNGDHEGYSLGEGVALVVLKRHSDAKRDGDKILGIIDSVGMGFDNRSLAQSVRVASESTSQSIDSASKLVGRLGVSALDQQAAQVLDTANHRLEISPNVPITGHLQGAQGLVDVITCSLDKQHARQVILGHTLSGQSALVRLTIPDAVSPPALTDARVTDVQRMDRTASAPHIQTPAMPTNTHSAQFAQLIDSGFTDSEVWHRLGLEIRYWSADTLEGLKSAAASDNLQLVTQVPTAGKFVATVVAPIGQSAIKARKLAALIGQSQAIDQLIDQGIWWVDRSSLAMRPPRIAFAFSGQGSQYAGMLSGLPAVFPVAGQLMQHADEALRTLDGSTFAGMAWASDNQLGENVWQTQASLLVADSMLSAVIQSLSIYPEVVFGHSYGEIPAMLAAGSLHLETAVRLTWHRCQSVTMNAPTGCSMLSVQADEKTVAKAIADFHLPLTISHVNAPQQTVVGGKHSQIAQLAAILDDSGVASRVLPVPTAFHTPALQAAVEPFRRALQSLPIQPPRLPLLSSVNNCFMADPDLIRDGLAEQLVTPLRFVSLLEKLAAQGITHVVEVGPQRVLTRLARACGTGIQVFSSDYGPQGENSPQGFLPLALLHAFSQMTAGYASSGQRLNASVGRFVTATANSIDSATAPAAVKTFDATAARRQRMRSQSAHNRGMGSVATPSAPMANVSSPVVIPVPSPVIQTPPLGLSQAAAQPAPATPVHAPPVQAASIDVPATAEVEQILIDFVVEQTGYPAEIVELDADLEADLGIDSIKKAQLLGELRELFPQAMASMQSAKSGTTNDVRAQGNRLASLRTLRDFVNLLASRPSNTFANSSAATASTAIMAAPIVQPVTQVPTPVVQSNSQTTYSPITPVATATQIAPPPVAQTPPITSTQPTTNTQPAISRKSLEQFVVDFVVEQTGYPAEIVELDADLEADLGIDSIKKAQLLGELRETFALKLGGTNDASGTQAKSKSGLDQLRTLNQILDLLAAQVGCVNDAPAPNEVVPAIETVAHQNAAPEVSVAPVASPASVQAVSVVEVATVATVAQPLQVQVTHDPSAESADTTQRSSSQRNLPTYHADHKNGFADAVRLNLRALPARQCESSNLSLIKKIEESPSLKSAAMVLAEHADVCETSLVAFDQEIVRKSTWRLLNPQMQPSTATTRFLLELSLPNWLTEGSFKPLGVKHLPEGQIEVLTPGAITPMVLIDGQNNLYAVGSSSTDGKLELSAKLKMLSEMDPSQLSTTLRGWEQPADWWLLVVDVHRSLVMHFQRQNQIFSHSQCHLNRWAENGSMGADVWARVGFDCDAQQWIADTKSGPLHRAERMVIKSSLSLSQNKVAEFSASTSASVAVLEGGQGEQAANCEALFFESQFLSAFSAQELNESFQNDELSVTEVTQSTDKIAQRYILRMAPAPQIEVPGRQPTWSGKAIVVGNNPIADQLVSRLRASGVDVVRMIADGVASETALAEQFTALAQHEKLPHLFITSPCDADAKLSLDRAAWNTRRNAGLMSIFWLCQKWVDHVTSLNITDDASLIAVSSLGGDFGISGGVHSAEGGGINGLLKSILIESWMQGYRSLPIKTIDTDPSQSPVEIVNNIYRELAISSYDNEISYKGGVRQILKAIPRSAGAVDSLGKSTAANSASKAQLRPLTRGGAWVCTGGARGITALVAERLAERYGITLHLLGTAPAPNLDASWRDLDTEGLRQLKLQVMTDARKLGVNPVKHWQDTEKQMEIDATLRRLHSMGIKAHYHSCDVANRSQLAEVINQVRAISGPIRGVVHGAGVGRDSRFDRKQPEKVAQCISAKVDGALALMEATWNDPLEAFVGFGSISGRFGANGHTDYSLANEMLCKQIDWLKHQRPEVRAIGFHWHAWGDVGMATKPETKLALEMIHMQFMPAEEGIEHLITELEADAGESEVLITDDRYYRAFYPAETLVESSANAGSQIATPMLTEVEATVQQRKWTATVNPVKDPFLAEHLLDSKPLLPFVVASEMIYEAAASTLNSSQIVLREVQAHGAVRFFSEGIQELTLATSAGTVGRASIELRSDFVSRKGVVVDRDRLNFSAKAGVVETSTNSLRGSVQLPIDGNVSWQSVHYPPADAEFYVGWPLQKLRKVALTSEGLLGKISAPALIELAGVTRSTQGWRVPSAALDACLFAVGILAWQRIAPGSALPVRMGQLQLGRLPRPGESLTIHAVMKASSEGVASFDFSLYGVDGALILDVADYEVAWLSRTQAGVDQAAEQERG